MQEYYDDEELEEIRRRKLLELQRRLEEEAQREAIRREYELRKREILRHILTPEARQRLANIRMVRPQLAEQLELQLISLAQSGRIQGKITDDQLKRILAALSKSKKDREIRIIRK